MTDSNSQTKAPQLRQSRFALLQASRTGVMSTARAVPTPAPSEVPETAQEGAEGKDFAPENVGDVALTNPASKTDVSYRGMRTTSDATRPIALTEGIQEPLSPDRLQAPKESVFQNLANQKTLKVTAAGSKALMRLFAALAKEPGSGAEVPAHIRTQILNHLVRASHDLANDVAESIVDGGRNVPVYLRAKLLQQAADFVSEQWQKTGMIDTGPLKEIAKRAFGGAAPYLNQDVADLFHLAGEYTKASTQEISQSRITEAAVRATWAALREVQGFDLSDYDSEREKEEPAPFSYGRDPHSVAGALARIALEIAKENELVMDDLDISTTWTQNSIDRAITLVRAEYQFLTDRALRSAFKDDLFSEAALQGVNALYDQIMRTVQERARNGYILVERNAVNAMAATSYVHYLPKARPSVSSATQQPDTSEHGRESVTCAPNLEKKSGSTFSFGQRPK